MSAIANWRNQSEYPAVGEKVLLSQWHWEFLRRNSEYQEDYRKFKALPDDDEGREKKQMLSRKYGLDGVMFDYRDSMKELFISPRDPEKIRKVKWQTDWIEDSDGKLVEGHKEEFDYLDPKIRQHEYGLIFNLRNPVNLQLEKAKQYLEDEKKRFEEKRGKINDYPLYLRLLDADADNVPYDEIAEVLFADVDVRIARKRIEEEMKKARKLRDVNYRYI